MMSFTASPGQTVFARWKNSYYYSAVVEQVLGDHYKVTCLADGVSATVTKEDIVELNEAFETMNFQGNWQHGGFYYKGVITSHLPVMVMHYNDGDVEQITLSQLRGSRPGDEKSKPKVKVKSAEERAREPVLIQSEKEAIKELKAMRRSGQITKEEYKRRRDQLR